MNSKKYNNLIFFVSEYNDFLLIAYKILKPKSIILMIDKDELYYDESKDILDFFDSDEHNVNISIEKYDFKNIGNIDKILSNFDILDSLVVASNYKDTENIFCVRNAVLKGLAYMYFDVENHKLILINQDKVEHIEYNNIEVDIEELLNFSGAGIKTDNSLECENPRNIELTKVIAKNQTKWKAFKTFMYQISNRYDYNEIKEHKFSINFEEKDAQKGKLFLEFLYLLKKQGFLDLLVVRKNTVVFRLISNKMEAFLLKFGNWLETLTYNTLKGFKSVDDIKSGMVFLWDKENYKTKNEIDVVASIDSRLICISCKDTSRVYTDHLNELVVYGEEIGGNNCLRILVVSKMPRSNDTITRAKELGIKIVVYSGDLNLFKLKLEEAIKG